MKFLQYNSPFMTLFRKIVDYFLLGVLWVVASAPIITAGAATTATLMTAELSVRDDEGKILKPFWKHFRAEFKKSTILWLIELPILAMLVFYAIFLYQIKVHYLVGLVSYVLIVLIFMWTQMWLAYESKFEDKIKTVMINSLRITLGNLGTSVLITLLDAITILLSCVFLIFFQPILLVIPGIYIVCYTAILRKLFKRLLPPKQTEQEMLEEPAEAE